MEILWAFCEDLRRTRWTHGFCHGRTVAAQRRLWDVYQFLVATERIESRRVKANMQRNGVDRGEEQDQRSASMVAKHRDRRHGSSQDSVDLDGTALSDISGTMCMNGDDETVPSTKAYLGEAEDPRRCDSDARARPKYFKMRQRLSDREIARGRPAASTAPARSTKSRQIAMQKAKLWT